MNLNLCQKLRRHDARYAYLDGQGLITQDPLRNMLCQKKKKDNENDTKTGKIKQMKIQSENRKPRVELSEWVYILGENVL